MFEHWSDPVEPFGDDGPLLTMIQMLGMATLLSERLEDGVEGWHMCDNGCCVLVHENGHDESVWCVTQRGRVVNVDRYNNDIEVLVEGVQDDD